MNEASKISIGFLIVLILSACTDKEYNYYTVSPEVPGGTEEVTSSYTVADLMPSVKVVPECFEQSVFTSYLYMIPLIGKSNLPQGMDTYLTKDCFELSLRAPYTGASFTIRQRENLLSEAAVVKGTFREEGGVYSVRPDIAWKYEALRQWGKTRMLSVVWDVWIDDQYAGNYSMPFSFRSISECVLGVETGEDSYCSLYPFFAGYVEEESALCDRLLVEALKQGLVPSFVGYQAGNEAAVEQACAIWYLMLQKGIKYSNSTIIPGIDYAQNVRFIEQSYTSGMANCVEGSVLLASIYMRFDLDCDLVLIPGHMFLLVRDDEGKILFPLETTMMGNVDLSAYATEKERRKASTDCFVKAVNEGRSELEKAMPHIEAGEAGYRLLNIREMRDFLPSINAGTGVQTRSRGGMKK